MGFMSGVISGIGQATHEQAQQQIKDEHDRRETALTLMSHLADQTPDAVRSQLYDHITQFATNPKMKSDKGMAQFTSLMHDLAQQHNANQPITVPPPAMPGTQGAPPQLGPQDQMGGGPQFSASLPGGQQLSGPIQGGISTPPPMMATGQPAIPALQGAGGMSPVTLPPAPPEDLLTAGYRERAARAEAQKQSEADIAAGRYGQQYREQAQAKQEFAPPPKEAIRDVAPNHELIRVGANGQPTIIATVPPPAKPVNPQKLSLQEQIAQDWLKLHPGKNLWDYEQAHTAIKEGTTASLTPEAQEMYAQQVAAGGPLPSFGFGGKVNASLKAQISNRAAAILEGKPLAEQVAVYSADKTALAQLTRNLNAVSAFENTAKKNLSTFIDKAKSIVDTGSPWLNAPLRTVDLKLLGSPEQAAANTALLVARTEIARVLNNPNLVGILTNEARKELQDTLSPDASLAQIYSVSSVLLNDMDNRKGALEDQSDIIRKQMGAVDKQKGKLSGPPPVAPGTEGNLAVGGTFQGKRISKVERIE